MDAYRPKPRWEDDRNRGAELLKLLDQIKRNYRQMVAGALFLGLFLGFLAGVYFEDRRDQPKITVNGAQQPLDLPVEKR